MLKVRNIYVNGFIGVVILKSSTNPENNLFKSLNFFFMKRPMLGVKIEEARV